MPCSGARSGSENRVQYGCFDAAFSDLVMSGMSRAELELEIRHLHSVLPGVLTSGYRDMLAEEGQHGFELL